MRHQTSVPLIILSSVLAYSWISALDSALTPLKWSQKLWLLDHFLNFKFSGTNVWRAIVIPQASTSGMIRVCVRVHKNFNLAYNTWTTIGGAFIFHMCIPCDKTFPWVPKYFKRTSESSVKKSTATNQMHSSDLEAFGKKCCYFWLHSEGKFLTRLWRLFGLSHFGLFLHIL